MRGPVNSPAKMQTVTVILAILHSLLSGADGYFQ